MERSYYHKKIQCSSKLNTHTGGNYFTFQKQIIYNDFTITNIILEELVFAQWVKMTKILQVYICVTKAELISTKIVNYAGCHSFCRDRYASWQLYIVSCFLVFLTLAARKCSRILICL